MSTIESICSDLGVMVIPCNETSGPMKTKAGQILRGLLRDHGEGHVFITVRTIIESSGNDVALIAPVIHAVSDLIRSHRTWPERGLAWIEAFDDIDLIDLAKRAKANKKAVPARQAMATLLYERLAPMFDPPKPPKHRSFKHSRTTPRYAREQPAS